MKEEIKEKWEDFVILVFSILLDAALILVVGIAIFGVKYVFENWVFHSKIEETDNKAFLMIYSLSKIFMVIAFFLYILWDIVSQLIKMWKKIRK